MSERVVRFRSFDGVELEGTLLKPQEQLANPILLVHGIDSDREEYGFFTRMASALAAQGIVTLRFDWRCYGHDSERPLAELTLAGLANDIQAGATLLLQAANANELSVIAASFGGGVAVAWSRTTKLKIGRMALLAPVLSYSHDYLEAEGLGTEEEGVSHDAAKELMEKGFLLTSGRPFSRQLVAEFPYFSAEPPGNQEIVIMHGTEDTGVPYINSKRFVDRHPNVALRTFPGAEHGFAAPGDGELEWPETLANHETVYGWLIEFFLRRS